MDLLAAGAQRLAIALDADQLRQFQRYADELLAWNARANLTAITTPAGIQLRHFLDSLTCLIPLRERWQADEPLELLDVGTGAGFPGLPLKLVWPALRLTLLDSVAKKTAFLEHLVRVLGLEGVRIITARAEELGRQPDHRDHYDVVVSRAVAELPVLVELGLPFLRPGGLLIAPRKGDLAAQIAAAGRALAELGGRARPPIPIELPGEPDGRGLVVVEKLGPTPERYPRRTGIPEKRPLR